jgi:hypothetical protein
VSAGHRYRVDGWCAHPECFRNIADEVDLNLCPDRHGYDVPGRIDLPADKRDQHARASKQRTEDTRAAFFALAAKWFR